MRASTEMPTCCPLCGVQTKPADQPAAKTDLTLLIKENKRFLKIKVKQIEVVEAMKDYLKIYIGDRVIITHMTMSKIEEMLDERLFWRINRSFIVKKSFISSITYNTVEMTNKMLIPVGINYRDFIKEIIVTGYFK